MFITEKLANARKVVVAFTRGMAGDEEDRVRIVPPEEKFLVRNCLIKPTTGNSRPRWKQARAISQLKSVRDDDLGANLSTFPLNSIGPRTQE